MRLPDNIKRISGDFLINILSSVIYTFARQIVVFPFLAARLSEEEYGTFLTVIGLTYVCTSLIGTSLNNIRLVQEDRYAQEGVSGDFLPLCAMGCGLSVLFSLVLWLLFDLSAVTVLLLTAYIILYNIFQYATAHFRLTLDFKRNLKANVLISIAYLPPILVFATPQLWPLIFLIGDGVGLLYTAVSTRFYKEPFARTPLFGETAKKLVLFTMAGLVGNFLTYADRMIIYPTLGAECVSYYSTASFFGKSAGIVMTPIAGVLLGYFAQKNFSASKKLFTLVNGLSLACLGVFLVGCRLLAPWFTELLYPTLYAQSAPYIMLANLGAVIAIAGNMAQPMILKCCSTKWLLFIQLLYSGAYLLSAWLLMPPMGLLGFCWATILANSVRLLALYAIGYWKF